MSDTISGLAMNYQLYSQNNFHQSLSPEQLNQLIEAIVDGRYSWACVLILRFIGYNPLHFIPQRTYSRLIKGNSQSLSPSLSSQNQIQSNTNSSENSCNEWDSSRVLSNLQKMDYLETLNDKQLRSQRSNSQN